jgi:hypothetical protein
LAPSAGLFGGRGRRWLVAAAAAAAFAFAFYSIVILLRTPDGTLRIVSEVDDVQIAVLKNEEVVRELTVGREGDMTRLRAGQYEVRFTGPHDGLKFENDVITLTRGREAIARIVHEREVGAKPDIADAVNNILWPPGVGPEGRIYKGKPESEWQQIFLAEIDPTAKYEAAQALLQIAAQKLPRQQMEQILDIGAEMIRAEAGSNSLELVFEYRSYPSHPIYGDVQTQLQKLPLAEVVSRLCRATRHGTEARAAFALRLLLYYLKPIVDADPEASRIVLRDLDMTLTGLDRSAACLIVRTAFSNRATEAQVESMVRSLGQLVTRLQNAGSAEGRMRDQLVDALLGAAGVRSDWPEALKLAFAELALQGLIAGRPDVVGQFKVDLVYSGVPGATPPYDARFVANAREYSGHYLDKWLDVVNPWLNEHRVPPFEDATRKVVKALEKPLLLYSDGDDWPADQTAAILTELLRRYYTDDPNATTADSVEKLLLASPASLLTQIVRSTGQIPDFVRSGHPRPAAVNDRLKKFAAAVESWNGRHLPNHNGFAGLYDDAPLEVIRLAMGAMPPTRRNAPAAIPTRHWLILASTGASVTVTAQGTIEGKPDSFVDPLLLLAALHDLAGESENQDLQIARLLGETETGFQSPGFHPNQAKDPRAVGLKVHLQNVLASPLKARHHARRMLEEMAAKAKGQELRDAVKVILAEEQSGAAEER